MISTMKTARLFKSGRSKAVRIPNDWVEGVHEVEMVHDGTNIILKPKKSNLWEVARECRELGGEVDRLPRTETGVRVKF